MTNKRALVCAPYVPQFDREGGSRRIYDLIVLLQDLGWLVTLIAEDMSSTAHYAHRLQQRGVMVFGGSTSMQITDAYLADSDEFIALAEFDIAILSYWYTAEHFLPIIRNVSPQTRIIIDEIDLDFLRKARGRLGDHQQSLDVAYAHEMVRELNTYFFADAVMTVSQKEADWINDFVGDDQLAHNVPLMRELEITPKPYAERRGILFVGSFRHAPNVQAVEFLLEDIVPYLSPATLAEHPMYIVGNAMSQSIIDLGANIEHVHTVGWVPSLLPYWSNMRISVAPLLSGAGTKVKVIEALTSGIPTISTSIGAEGLGLENGEHILIADKAASFANAIEHLLTTESLWQHLAQHGQQHIQTQHSQNFVKERLRAIIAFALSKPPRTMPGKDKR